MVEIKLDSCYLGYFREIFFEKSCGNIWWNGKVGVLLHPQIRNEAQANKEEFIERLTITDRAARV